MKQSASAVNPEFVERCQLEYEKNPQSKVFAPLAEAYRKMGLLDEANRICKRGVQLHPDFAGGRVAYAKVLLDLKAHAEALTQLQRAVDLSPDNLLAHGLMGETLIELRRPKEALKAFKMVLFLNPSDERARQAVRKWEFLTADEYDEEVFQMKPLFADSPEAKQQPAGIPESRPAESVSHHAPVPDGNSNYESSAGFNTPSELSRAVERAISLADAFTVRNDLEAALDTLEQARKALGPVMEIENRRALISKRLQALTEVEPEPDETQRFESTYQTQFEVMPDQNLVNAENEPPAGDDEDDDEIDHSVVIKVPASAAERDRRRQILDTLLQRISVRRLGG